MNRLLSSTAVMQRRLEPADSLDFFPTPPWGTRAFLAHVMPALWPHPDIFAGAAWDPCCGEGHMALVLTERFADVAASDIHPYGFGSVCDFLHPDAEFMPAADWIFINPPFNRAEEFVGRALQLARRGVAVLARVAFAEGQGRFKALFRDRPPQIEAIFVERLPMHRGRYVVGPRAKSATSYAWFGWLKHPPHDWRHTRKIWIPPCRKALSRPDDWLRFGACEDLPKGHPALEAPAIETADDPAARMPLMSDELAAVRAELELLLP